MSRQINPFHSRFGGSKRLKRSLSPSELRSRKRPKNSSTQKSLSTHKSSSTPKGRKRPRKSSGSSQIISPVRKKKRINSPEKTAILWKNYEEPFLLKDVSGFPKYTDILELSPISPTRYDTSPLRLKLFSEEKEGELIRSILEPMKKKKSLKPFWYTHNEYFDKLKMRYLEFLMKQYGHLGVCLFDRRFGIYLRCSKGECTFVHWFNWDEYMKSFSSCLRNDKIRIISLLINVEYDDSPHLTVAIINKNYKTIEYFDPHGSTPHKKRFEKRVYDKVYEILSNYVKGYTFVEMNDVGAPRFGFQYWESIYGKKYRELSEIGLCSIWSLYILHLRLEYNDLDPETFQEGLRRTLDKKLSHFKTHDEKKNYLGKFFGELIVNYLLYMKKKTNF